MLAQLGDGPSPGLAPGTCQPVAGTRLHSPKRVAVTERENRFFLTLVGSLFSRRRNLGGHSLADLVISETEEVTQELGEHGLGAARAGFGSPRSWGDVGLELPSGVHGGPPCLLWVSLRGPAVQRTGVLILHPHLVRGAGPATGLVRVDGQPRGSGRPSWACRVRRYQLCTTRPEGAAGVTRPGSHMTCCLPELLLPEASCAALQPSVLKWMVTSLFLF